MPDGSVARAIKQGCSTIMRHNPDDGIMYKGVDALHKAGHGKGQ
jgi:hypothetical protein